MTLISLLLLFSHTFIVWTGRTLDWSKILVGFGGTTIHHNIRPPHSHDKDINVELEYCPSYYIIINVLGSFRVSTKLLP